VELQLPVLEIVFYYRVGGQEIVISQRFHHLASGNAVKGVGEIQLHCHFPAVNCSERERICLIASMIDTLSRKPY